MKGKIPAHSTEDMNEYLIVSYLNGNLTDAHQIQQMEDWLSTKENLQAAREIYKAWELSMLAVPTSSDTAKAYSQVSDKLNIGKKTARVVSLWWYAAAASVVLAVGLVFSLQTKEEKFTTLSSAEQKEDYLLPDGSQVSLNSQSLLSYVENNMTDADQRVVKLTGEAFFEVAHDPEHPFIVQTNDAEVKVLGTKFMVTTDLNSPTKVLVTEGKVQVTFKETGKVVILEKEEEIALETLDNSSEEDVVVKSSDTNQLYWKTGVMKFEHATLEKVFQTLSEEFDTTIVSDNKKILACDITATFKKKSLDTIIEVIKNIHQLESRTDDQVIIISGEGCE
ncbi:FecR family protein [Reichenbachiella versicolor]|uniref:FecR family protein n=1 Tax=Reichenbachiella versicolor TaxID=1821036 RepID=UPI000D6E6A87|nr:FecR domain-containing protein [Reichenbachiella versicolor]